MDLLLLVMNLTACKFQPLHGCVQLTGIFEGKKKFTFHYVHGDF